MVQFWNIARSGALLITLVNLTSCMEQSTPPLPFERGLSQLNAAAAGSASATNVAPSSYTITPEQGTLSLDTITFGTAKTTELLENIVEHFPQNKDFSLTISVNPFTIRVDTAEASIDPVDEECVFCAGQFRGTIIDQDQNTIAVEKANPARKPIDFLIIPRKHLINYKYKLGATSPIAAALAAQLAMAQKLARKLKNSDDVTLFVNNGKNVGQSVFHSHMHFKSGSSWK